MVNFKGKKRVSIVICSLNFIKQHGSVGRIFNKCKKYNKNTKQKSTLMIIFYLPSTRKEKMNEFTR